MKYSLYVAVPMAALLASFSIQDVYCGPAISVSDKLTEKLAEGIIELNERHSPGYRAKLEERERWIRERENERREAFMNMVRQTRGDSPYNWVMRGGSSSEWGMHGRSEWLKRYG